MDKVYVIYKDGIRYDPKKEGGMSVKVAYLKKGSANGVVTTLVNEYVSYVLGLSSWSQQVEYEKAVAEEKARYQVVEYIPNEEVMK